MRIATVVFGQPSEQRGVDEQWMSKPALQRCVPFNLAHNSGVIAHAGMEAKVSAVDVAQPDRFDSSSGDSFGQLLYGNHRIVGHAQRAGEDVGATTGQNAKRSVGTCDTRGYFVERAIAAVSNHDIDPTTGCILGESGGMTAAVGLDDLDVIAHGQGAVHDDRVTCGHRRGERIDHEQDAQGPNASGLGPSGHWSHTTVHPPAGWL